MQLYTHQQRFLEANPKKALLAWEMGTGKSLAAIEWSKKRTTTLIVVPKGLKTQWENQIHSSCVCVTKEEFKKLYKTLPRYDAVVVDEADHFFSANFKSALSKSLRAYLKKHTPDLLLLTGTPYRSSAWNIYTAATLLGYRWSYRDFNDAFFYPMRMGRRIIYAPRTDEKTVKRLRDAIHKIADVVAMNECVDIPEQLDIQEVLGLTAQQKQQQQNNPEVVPIARFTADHRIETGGHKLERIERIIEEERKVIVVCRYLSHMDELVHIATHSVDGSTKNRHEVFQDFNNATEGVLVVQADLCEGYELPNCATMIFASMSFSYRNYVQMKARILRMNHLHKNKYIHLIGGDADRAVLQAIKEKKDFDVTKYYDRKTTNR